MSDSESSSVSEFVDTSVIVRYLVRDSPDQTELALRIIEGHPALLITPVIIAEAGFVLTRVYSQPRDAVVDALIALLRRTNLNVHQIDKDIAIQALLLCRPSARVSFADAMLWASARQSGAGAMIYTLDRRFPAVEITIRGDLPE